MLNQPNLKLTGKRRLQYSTNPNLFLVLKAEGLIKRSFFCKIIDLLYILSIYFSTS